MAQSMEAIAKLLKNTRFRKRILGGVDEDDVWKKLGRLQQEYQQLIAILTQQHEGALNEYRSRVTQMERERATWEAQGAMPRASSLPNGHADYPPRRRNGRSNEDDSYPAYQRPQEAPFFHQTGGQPAYAPGEANGHLKAKPAYQAYQQPAEAPQRPPDIYHQPNTQYVPRAMRYVEPPQEGQPSRKPQPFWEDQPPARDWQHWMRPPGQNDLRESHG